MAYGVTTRMFLAPAPETLRPDERRGSALWRQLRADEKLRAIEHALKVAA